MRPSSWARARAITFGAAVALSTWTGPAYSENLSQTESGANCSFKADPDRFLSAHGRTRKELLERGAKLERALAQAGQSNTMDAATVPKRNFVDEEIFGRLAREGVRSAKLSTDEEFLRRIYLDLTGRIPAPEQVREFSANTDPGKRDRVIDKLLFSAEFTDKWTMWFGDLLENNANASNVNLQVNGRNAFHNWIRQSVGSEKSIKDIAYESVVGSGNNFESGSATANFYVKARTPGGPAQDTYDAMLFKTARAFLSLAYYDCLLCHNGRGHLDQLSLWGRAATRIEAWRMAAFFSRTRLTQPYNRIVERTDFYYNSFAVTDTDTGQYVLNTNFGNRPARAPVGTVRNPQPEYRETGAKPGNGENWRGAFAENMVRDPMFARNFANRLWKAMFNLGLVDPVDTMDPARLDPNAELPAGWSLQATHPELLERLAGFFVASNYSLRETLRLLAQSSAYQLSSHYDSEWNIGYVPLFARHYVRRLEGEEVHDAVQTATGVIGSYEIAGWSEPVSWAMQLPDTIEPRRDRAAAFMNHFARGNRDTQPRNQAGSIQQQLALMNDSFVNSRIRVSASPNLQTVAQLGSSKEIVERVFLLFLSRKPSAHELETAVAYLDTARNRTAAIEDLAWTCVNKVDFLFSY